jgi:hypothetical protein
MSNVTKSTTVQFPILAIMFLIFMTLKLCGVIAWSWIPIVIVLTLFAVVGTVLLLKK